MKRTGSFQSLRIEVLACAAVQASAIRIFADGEWAADLFVPAAEKFAEETDFAAERFVCSIDNGCRDSILF